MIRSMTGFGAAEGRMGSARVSIELRTVNHRFFSPSLKLPGAFARWEGDVRELLRQRIARGHVTLAARVDRDVEGGGAIDEARFGAYVAQLRGLRERHGLAGDVDLATVLRLPDVLDAGSPEEQDQGTAAELLEIVGRAADALTTMRAEEGARLAQALRDRLGIVSAALDRIEARAPQRIVEQRDSLRQRVRELLDGVAPDEQRLAQEIAILADRLDVSEEMTRFRSHVTAFHAALDDGREVGKRLGFLLQEMLREANTTGSKGNDAAVTADVILIKEELERIREQVENLE